MHHAHQPTAQCHLLALHRLYRYIFRRIFALVRRRGVSLFRCLALNCRCYPSKFLAVVHTLGGQPSPGSASALRGLCNCPSLRQAPTYYEFLNLLNYHCSAKLEITSRAHGFSEKTPRTSSAHTTWDVIKSFTKAFGRITLESVSISKMFQIPREPINVCTFV